MVIDITDVVEKLKDDFIFLETERILLSLASIPGLQWLLLPIIKQIAGKLINIVVSKVANGAYFGAFATNTVIRKNLQAQEYTEIIKALDAATTPGEYAVLERKKMRAFVAIASVTE